MTFISYSQNLEDVLLWRALKTVENGFYIDVGAQDPVNDSVTKAFYERHWHGINLEPSQHYHRLLCKDRPKDINLAIGAGASNGTIEYYEIENTGLSTTDKSVAEEHSQAGKSILLKSIPINTLTSICEQYVNGIIHFLKIDVEGAEKDVIAGIDFTRFRPWILIIESTIPNRTQQNYEHWEPLLLTANYQFVYFDGLNRYYIAKEQQHLEQFFNSPVSCFDDYISIHYYRAKNRIQELDSLFQNVQTVLHETEANLQQHQQQLVETQRQLVETQRQLVETTRRLQSVYNSLSWRITQPLRAAKSLFKRI
jgi:FkbM family methyltransferase